MGPLSPLCCVCNKILNSSLTEHILYKPHHETLEGFQKAISQGCYVCSTMWKGFGEKHRDAWMDTRAAWYPMKYRVYKEEGEKGLVKLSILYLDPISNNVTDTRFRMIPSDDDEFRPMFSIPYLEATTSSSLTLDAINNWYLSCHASHNYCSRIVQPKPWYPSRLLNIGAQGETQWKLHLPSENQFPPPAYVTLSYRWGSNLDFKLTKSKLKSEFGGRIEDLPQTFRDAISVARRLSVRYLWIDRLCILQDSKMDWEHESVAMRHVYANSLCNIAASASTNPEGGLFRPRDPENIRPGFVRAAFATPEDKSYHIFDKNYSERQVFAGPLHRRGWVFQERILAPRTVHFAEDQVFWECFTELKCEAFPHGIPLSFPLKDFDSLWKTLEANTIQQDLPSLHVFNLWNDLVKQYTKCALTRESDKLVAFSGLARLFQDLTGDEYVAGLWRSRLAEHLDWRVYTPVSRSASEYRAPSWSWASLSGPVEPQGLSAGTQMHVTILDVQVRSSQPDSMGFVSAGYVKLGGILIQATCRATETNGRYMLEVGPRHIKGWMFPDALGIGLEEGKAVVCLILRTEPRYLMLDNCQVKRTATFTMRFLVLEPLCSVSNTYRRLGCFELDEREWMEELGISITKDGLVVTSEENKPSVITLV